MAIPKGKRSGGPKTSSGKAASAKNALSHGAYASGIQEVPVATFRATFAAFTQELLAELKPQGPTQKIVAEQIAREAWRIQQLANYEQVVLEGMSQNKPTAQEVHDELGLNWPSWQVPLLDEPLPDLPALVIGDPLLPLLKRLTDFYLEHNILTLRESDEALYKSAEGLLTRVKLDLPRLSVELDITVALLKIHFIGIPGLRDLFPPKELALAEGRKWIVQHAEEIGQAIDQCINRRMLQAITSPNLLRARTTINKTLFALMSEYRELQSRQSALALMQITDQALGPGTGD